MRAGLRDVNNQVQGRNETGQRGYPGQELDQEVKVSLLYWRSQLPWCVCGGICCSPATLCPSHTDLAGARGGVGGGGGDGWECSRQVVWDQASLGIPFPACSLNRAGPSGLTPPPLAWSPPRAPCVGNMMFPPKQGHFQMPLPPLSSLRTHSPGTLATRGGADCKQFLRIFPPRTKGRKITKDLSGPGWMQLEARPGLTYPVPGTITNEAVKSRGTPESPHYAVKPARCQQAPLQHFFNC